MTFQANARIGGNLGCPVVERSVPKTGQVLVTDKTAMDFRRRLPEIRWQSCLSSGELAGDQYASPRLSIPRTRMRSGGSRQKKTRHLPTRRRSSPGRSLRDFTSPWPVAAKRTRAASIRAWTTRSRRARSRTAAGRKTTRRITSRAGGGLPPRGHRRPVPCGPDPAWPRFRHQ